MNVDIEQKIKQIIEKGHEYKRKWLEQYNINTLLTDWWALKFYFNKSFNRGRRDSMPTIQRKNYRSSAQIKNSGKTFSIYKHFLVIN